MRQILEAIRRGGGDEMVVTRAYRIDDRLYCDLRNPLNCDVFFQVPVAANLGATIDAPETPWYESTIPWEDLPRVIVTYRSSQGQSLLGPIVTGVTKNKANKVVAPAASGSTSRPPNPTVGDVSMATSKAKVIARAAGHIDLIADLDFEARAQNILLIAGVQPPKALTIAEELRDALQPLYDTVNKLVSFANSFPTVGSVSSNPAVVAAGGVLPTPLTITMTYGIVGVNASTQAPLIIPVLPFDLVPYDGPSTINNPPSADYDTPTVRASPRN
jgi:hypothetical protein